MECLPLKENIVWKTAYQLLAEKLNGGLHIFKIAVDEHFQKIEAIYKDFLTEREILKSNRFTHKKDRDSYIVRKYMTRKILSSFLNMPQNEIQYDKAANKKPIVQGLEFNVSHSNGLILIAVCSSPVGIDVELMKKDFSFTSLLADCFHPNETILIKNSQDQLTCFYGLWTRKEAILKATGEGLIEELPEINCLPNQITRKNETFNLLSFLVEKHYVASIAVSSLVQEINFWTY
ncbi:MAG: 4'-phosphopantetheinyl transferase superfamily protein [Bacteroidota bacterium]